MGDAEPQEVSDSQAGKEGGEGDDGDDHANSIAPQTVFGGEEIIRFAMISIVTSAIAAPVRYFSRAAAAQLWLSLNPDVFTNPGHNYFRWTSWLRVSRCILHQKITCSGMATQTRAAVLIRPMVYDRNVIAKSMSGRGRSEPPLQRGALPGVLPGRCSFKHTPEEVHKKEKLAGNGDDGCHGDELVQRRHGRNILHASEFRVSARISRGPQ